MKWLARTGAKCLAIRDIVFRISLPEQSNEPYPIWTDVAKKHGFKDAPPGPMDFLSIIGKDKTQPILQWSSEESHAPDPLDECSIRRKSRLWKTINEHTKRGLRFGDLEPVAEAVKQMAALQFCESWLF